MGLKMRLSWIIWVGPKANDKCPYKGYTKEKRRRLCDEKAEKGYAATNAKSDLKKCQEPPKAGRGKEGSSPGALREV